jgi:hypothetical protein
MVMGEKRAKPGLEQKNVADRRRRQWERAVKIPSEHGLANWMNGAPVGMCG